MQISKNTEEQKKVVVTMGNKSRIDNDPEKMAEKQRNII